MPSRWWIPLDADPAEIKVEHLHAAVSEWFDTTGTEHAALVKPYTLSPAAVDDNGRAGFELATLSDTAASRVAAGVPPLIRLGRATVRVGPATLVVSHPWTDLAASSGAKSWTLEFVTPATFRRRNRSSPLPVPATVLHGLGQSWDAHAPVARRPVPREQHQAIYVSAIDGCTESVTIDRVTYAGFLGQVTFCCDEQGVAAAVDPLFQLAPFAGVGSAKAKGLGVTRLHQPVYVGAH